tara:strand:+ start:11006 stop:11764 length:759 start_codon:yes stop_codon:yes gene_type:complete
MDNREKDNKSNKKGKKIDKEWSLEQTDILKKWGEAAACYRYMHNHAYLVFKRKNYNYSLPVIILSTITGTANFAQSSLPENIRSTAPAIIGGMNLIAGIIATVMQFLKISELMEGHRVASLQYGKLSRTIRLELSLPFNERSFDGSTMIDMCKAEYDKLIEQSPPLDDTIVKSFENQFNDEKTDFKLTKPEIMHIEPIELFTNEEHTNARMLKTELIEMQKSHTLRHRTIGKTPIDNEKRVDVDDLNEVIIK